MHIPDGFLDVKTAVGAAVISIAAVGVALRLVRRRLTPRQVPLMGLTATFVFAAQMLNFPIVGGTSGHLLGACLTAVLVGPAAAMIVMTAVLALQCLVFADGGLLALGANVLNMAVIGALVGGGVVRVTRRLAHGLRGRVVAAAFASWCTVFVASAACALELALSGTAPIRVVLPAMTAVHMVIGIGEAVITALVLVAIAAIRPELVTEGATERKTGRFDLVLGGVLVALCLAMFVAPFASSLSDGLESVAASLGFSGRSSAPLAAPLADYKLRGVSSPVVATALAGGIGTIVMLGLSLALGRLLVPRSARPASRPGA